MLASSHYDSSSDCFTGLFFFPNGLRPSLLSELPVDVRVRVLQWQRLDVVLEWREEDDSGSEVIKRSTSLAYPDLLTLSTQVCLFVRLVSTSSGRMPRLRVSTVSRYSLLSSLCSAGVILPELYDVTFSLQRPHDRFRYSGSIDRAPRCPPPAPTAHHRLPAFSFGSSGECTKVTHHHI